MEKYSVFTFYGFDVVARDLVRYCAENIDKLDFGDKLDLTYMKLEFGMGYMSVIINYNDYYKLSIERDSLNALVKINNAGYRELLKEAGIMI